MNSAWFEYNGGNSLDFGIQIENDISFSSPEADIEFVEVLGRDGELAINNKRLKGVNHRFPITLSLPDNMTIDYAATKISEWLKNDIGWHPLRFSGSPDYEYIAICYEQFDVKETLKRFGKTVITFKLKPFKRRIDNKKIELTNATTLINPETRVAKPILRIEAVGDVIFKNNGKDWIKLKSVEDFITIDSETMSVYKNGNPQFNKINATLSPMFPVLEKGENTITWTGKVNKVEIDPRWEAVV